MPRTKVTRKKRKTEISARSEKLMKTVLNILVEDRNNFETLLQKEYEQKKIELEMYLRDNRLKISSNYMNMTMYELKSGCYSTFNSQYIASFASSTQNNKKLKESRSKSVEDEGYRTESSNGNSGQHSSRSRLKAPKSHRKSRSLSRSKTTTANTSRFKTPMNKYPPPTNYSTITPKVKPNTPQVLVRRARVGEMVVSMQGSPVITGVVAESTPNVNIPLLNGNMLSLLPERGYIRESTLPNIDANTHRQLETLREHLTKICTIAAKQK